MPAPYHSTRFTDRYLAVLESAEASQVAESARNTAISERALQCLWYDQSFVSANLRTREGHAIEVISPGWWNHTAGPDFRGAQIAFNGELFTGDVEVHIVPESWKAHGHHLDARYDSVILHVVLDAADAVLPASTISGRNIPLFLLRPCLEPGWEWTPSDEFDEPDYDATAHAGACSALIPSQGATPLVKALELAGEWRMLTKARGFRERMDRAGGDQALYEMMLYAAGFSAFKFHFQALARQLPYERAVQLAQHDPMLLEAALLQLAGLLPDDLPEGTTAVPHHARLRALRRDHLSGMRPLPLVWKRGGLRPANNPERRLAGMARVVGIASKKGLLESVMSIWRSDLTPKESVAAFEKLFPKSMGFWAAHYTWTGQRLDKPIAPIGSARIHSIIGNVFLPAGLAVARQRNDRAMEERVLDFYRWLPKESANHILERMTPRLLGDSGEKLKLRFQLQQGMLQFHQDWCGPNPSCRNCTMHRYLDQGK